MKISLAFILLVAVGLCESNRLVCQIFDSSKKYLQQYCDNYNGPLPGNCSSDLNSTIESSQVNQLKIGGCDPEIVLESAKQFQRNLHSLDISYSGYKNLNWFNFTLNQLQIFNASHNELYDLRWFFFVEFPDIVEIDLSYNSLPRTYLGLRELKKLRRLHLSHNNFTTHVIMNNFPKQSIEYINLRSNHIEFLLAVPNNQFKKLKELHLEDNPFRSIDCDLLEDLFQGRLTSLFLSWSSLKSFLGLCMGNCQEKRMRIIRIDDPNEGIFITSNDAYEMRCNYKCFENVYYFNAGCNNFQNGNDVLQNIGSNVHYINLSGNFIGELSASAFDRFTKMNRLELSKTNLTWFDFDMLRNQKNEVSYVDISNNNLKELHNIPSLQNYILQELIIGGNQFENLYEIIENLNPSIKHLDLSEGNLGKVNGTTFRRLTELKRLNLSNTNLILPDSNPFEMLRNLDVLDLSHNNLENINFSIISATLYNLAELNLANCRIKDISTVIQYLGPNLWTLDLSENAAHGSINSLDFDLDVLKNQRKLKFLNISNNKLKTVDFKSFPFDSHIRINLEGNDLIELTNLDRHTSYQSTELELADNKFPCPYLKQLKEDYKWNIYLVKDSWEQKSDRDCRTTTQSINDFVTSVFDTIKFW